MQIGDPMQYLELSLPTVAENLALDEALLEEAEAASGEAALRETLRFWELSHPAVVVGRSSRVKGEVRTEVCRQLGIPVLRRISGGASIVAGPGCLMYSLILSYQRRPTIRAIAEAHRQVLDTLGDALSRLSPDVESRGTCDLTLRHLKFSGNSVRCRHNHLLYHGTILYNFPLDLIERCLAMPPRTPDYRVGRSHDAFVTNLPSDAQNIRRVIAEAWHADEIRTEWPRELVSQLVMEKYATDAWNMPG
jgi:lipoate---protein ligase